jgi:mono/diheme cytochrome c family protein
MDEMRRTRALAAAMMAILVGLLLAGCGGGGAGGPGGAPAGAEPAGTAAVAAGDRAAGKRIFLDSCGSCHTLADAGATGTAGPDLDSLKPEYARVVRQVTRGGGIMPAFGGSFSDREIEEVAAYVAAAAKDSPAGRPTALTFRPDDTRLPDCHGDFDCLAQAFGNLVSREGPRRGLAVLQQRMASDGAVAASCHRIAHLMGAAALARADGKVGVAVAEGSAVCASGYYHGILERSLAGVPDDRLAQFARSVCAGAAVRRVTFVAYQCIHGLGHGLMLHTGYDLPLALKTCDGLATAWDQTSCTGGVFMENITSSYGVKSTWLRDDLVYPCGVVDERDKLYCYLLVTSRILPATSYDWDKTAEICHGVEASWVATCFQSYGRDASGFTLGDPSSLWGLCEKAGDQVRECVYGAARDLVNTDADGVRAARFCAVVTDADRSYCFYAIGTIIGALTASNADRTAACRALSARFADPCMQGAGAPLGS